MSSTKIKVAIYSNIPSGGASTIDNEMQSVLCKKFLVTVIAEPEYVVTNFIKYLYLALIISPANQKLAIKNTKQDILVVHHLWLTKSPSILRYTTKLKIYFCHELMREYYDLEHNKIQTIKEKLVNLLRTPIKWLDYYNIHVKNTRIVANSNFSKKQIYYSYNLDSFVVYPGVDTAKFRTKLSKGKLNQVICVSAINKLKRQEFIVEVVSLIAAQIRLL